MLIQKSEGSSAFDEQKVKNIAMEYRLQSIFPNPGDRSFWRIKRPFWRIKRSSWRIVLFGDLFDFQTSMEFCV